MLAHMTAEAMFPCSNIFPMILKPLRVLVHYTVGKSQGQSGGKQIKTDDVLYL